MKIKKQPTYSMTIFWLKSTVLVGTRLGILESEHKEFGHGLNFISKDVDDLKSQVAKLQTTVKSMETSACNRTDREVQVAKSVDKLENDKNLKALLVANITISRNENLPKIVTTLSSHLGATVLNADIESAFRLKSDKATDPPLIMVKFNSLTARDKLYNARKMFATKSVDTTSLGFTESAHIYINEVMSKAQQSLFYWARKKRIELKWRYAWTFHGQVYMRQSNDSDAIKILSKQMLDTFSSTSQPSNG
jgi:hypothetical protein